MKKPSKAEEEHFAKAEIERRRKWEQERAAAMAADEKRRLRELHQMKCPKCGMDLQEIHMQGIMVDHCVTCRGLWLDLGELHHLQKAVKEKGILPKIFSIFD